MRARVLEDWNKRMRRKRPLLACFAYMSAHFPSNFQAILAVYIHMQQHAILKADHEAALMHAHAAHASPYLDLSQQLPVCVAPQLDRAVPASGGDAVYCTQLHHAQTRQNILVRLRAEQALGHA